MSQTDAIHNPLFTAGRLIKVHGVHGSFIVRMEQPVSGVVQEPDWAFLLIDGGPVPFRLDQEEFDLRDPSHLVVKFDGYDTRESISRFIDCEILMEGNWSDWFNQEAETETGLIGYEVFVEGHENPGIITGYLDIPGNPLFEMQWEGREVLVPERPEFIKNIDHQERKIQIEIPAQLLDL